MAQSSGIQIEVRSQDWRSWGQCRVPYAGVICRAAWVCSVGCELGTIGAQHMHENDATLKRGYCCCHPVSTAHLVPFILSSQLEICKPKGQLEPVHAHW